VSGHFHKFLVLWCVILHVGGILKNSTLGKYSALLQSVLEKPHPNKYARK